MTRHPFLAVSACIAIGAPFLLASCGKSRSAPKTEDAAITRESEKSSANELSPLEQAARNLEKGLKLREDQAIEAQQDDGTVEIDYGALAAASAAMNARNAEQSAANAAAAFIADPALIQGPPAPSTSGATVDTSAESEPIEPVASEPPPLSPSRAELSAQLVEVVRRAIREDADPLQAALPLIGLGLVEPGVSEPEMRALLEPLSPPEKATVLAVRELLAKVASGELSSTDPKALADALERQRDALLHAAGQGGLEHGTVALCTRVESFGQFTPMTSNRLLSGRSNPAIAYTEVRGFTQRPGVRANSSEEGFIVDLTQEIALYTDSERPVLQWRIPEQAVRSFSRSPRQDFYLVQRLDFPRTLAAGSYQLRITVRDKNALSRTDAPSDTASTEAVRPPPAMFEATLPVQVVADPALLREATGTTVIGSSD